MKTAIEELIETLKYKISECSMSNKESRARRGAYTDALIIAEKFYFTIEKQQIVDAFTTGNRQEHYDATETAGEQYYKNTFNK